jgi:hypothetical protein
MFSTLLELLTYGLVSVSGSPFLSDLIIQVLNPIYVLLLRVGL